MTLLQTRVDEQTARNFERAAKEHGHTKYSYLQEIVQGAAVQPAPRTWKKHLEWRKSLKLKPLPYGIVVKNREESGER